jgi:hypothetical protein
MPYVQLQDIKLGMDRTRKSRVVAELGSAWTIKNAHMSRGGDIERRKSLVKIGDNFPDTTKGLFAINDTLYTVGYDASEASNVPSGVTHILTQHPTPATVLTKVLDAEAFNGQLYSISQFFDGNIYHYYNTSRVVDWDTLSASIGSNNAIASALEAAIDNSAVVNASVSTNVVTITSSTAGTPFTISASTVNNGSNPDQSLVVAQTQANVAGVTEVVASADVTITGGTNSPGVNRITSITIDGVEILSTAVNWATSNSNMASLLKTQIDSYTSSPEYATSVNGATLTISALAGTGAAPNGFVVVVTVGGDVTVSADATLTGGVTAVTAVAQVNTVTVGGTFEETDQFTVTINGTEEYTVTGAASGTGTTVQTFKKKLYSVASSNLYFSALTAPTQWISGVDYGFINMASETSGEETLTATAEYQGLMAVFSENNIRIWSISEDSAANVFLQTLQNTGTVAPDSVVAYGNNDVFYLAPTGIRSIKARDSSNSAYVSDVGTAIDTHVREFLATLTDAQIASATAVIEPLDGRYWIAIGTRIYVFSYFPAKKISGWSYYDLDVTITHFARVGNRVYARATDDQGDDGLYIYGGVNNDTYPGDDEDIVEIELPFISANNPAAFKELKGFDIIGINEWKVEILPDPSDETVKVNHGIAVGVTYGDPQFGLDGVGALFGINLTCRKAGPATMSALALHHNGTFEDR